MSDENFTLTNAEGYSVTVPMALAEKYFLRIKEVESTIRSVPNGDENADAAVVEEVEDVEDTEEPTAAPAPAPEEPLRMHDLPCPNEVLDTIRDLVMHIGDWSDVGVVDYATEKLERALERKYMRLLQETALELKFEQLTTRGGRVIYDKIVEIERRHPTDPMQAAEEIRQLLDIKNEWTEEEMGHLHKEVEYAKTLGMYQ